VFEALFCVHEKDKEECSKQCREQVAEEIADYKEQE
jgi:hypothetical protein